jgi:SPOR domain
VRRIALPWLVLTPLLGCASHDRPAVQIDTSPVAAADSNKIRSPDSDNMRRVTGQPVAFEPLTPEPGDIWADLAFLKRRPPGGTQPQPAREATGPDATTAGHGPTGQGPTGQGPKGQGPLLPARQAGTPATAPNGQPTLPATIPPATIPPATTQSASARSPATPSAVSVQLAATGSEQAARAEWQRLQRLLPNLIGDRVPSVLPVNADGHSLWRLRTGGFATPAEATAFCTRLQSERSRCWVVARS